VDEQIICRKNQPLILQRREEFEKVITQQDQLSIKEKKYIQVIEIYSKREEIKEKRSERLNFVL